MNTNPVPQPANDHWNWTTAEARASFDQDHAEIPQTNWTALDWETWLNLHLTKAA